MYMLYGYNNIWLSQFRAIKEKEKNTILHYAFIPFLIGTKFDLFAESEQSYKQQITKRARKYATKMKSPLIYCSSAKAINIKKIFQVIIAKAFDMKSKIEESSDELHQPILEYSFQQVSFLAMFLPTLYNVYIPKIAVEIAKEVVTITTTKKKNQTKKTTTIWEKKLLRKANKKRKNQRK
ncbi:small GTPase [Reticulomyxa filosa]|uniref:Small GTPase n=1 Tax=Reticulomyxa filosa TaxID=46433 RepID=X6N072_RETFI|nr:small GTPase [Reticulomyxa filosa]|eukprot:ETO19139.1 small GTPase [Reticulomyxa filosa]